MFRKKKEKTYKRTQILSSKFPQKYSDFFLQNLGKPHLKSNSTVLILLKYKLKTYFNILSEWDTKSVDKMTLKKM